MRVLIDECVDPRVKLLLAEHQSATVHDKGWTAFEDRALLALAEKEFDVLPTIDGKMAIPAEYRDVPDWVIVIHVHKNQLFHYRAIQDELLLAVGKVQPGRVLHVGT